MVMLLRAVVHIISSDYTRVLAASDGLEKSSFLVEMMIFQFFTFQFFFENFCLFGLPGQGPLGLPEGLGAQRPCGN